MNRTQHLRAPVAWHAYRRRRVIASVSLLAALAFASLLGCKKSKDTARLLDVADVIPRQVEVGDRVEVLGTNLPTGDDLPGGTTTRAKVIFNGNLYRPGKPVQKDFKLTVSGKSERDRVWFIFNEKLRSKFCGVSDEKAEHTTFRGDVTVELPAFFANAPVTGTVKNVTIDVRPPSVRSLVMNKRLERGKKTLTELGIKIDDTATGKDGTTRAGVGGLRVIEAKKAAAKAGIQPGDVITGFRGVTVLSYADIAPPTWSRGNSDVAAMTVLRGRLTHKLEISLEGVESVLIPADILAALILLGIAVAVLLVFMAPTAGIITWVERRVAGRFQSRIGPNRVGPQGFFQWLADGIKSFMKEDIIPADCDKPLFRLAPYLVFLGVSATFVVMPFGQHLIGADLDIGILFIIAVTSLAAIGLLTGGWASNNKWSLLGGIRAAAQVVSYEIPAAIAIVCIVMMTGSLSMQEIIIAQGGPADGMIDGGIFTTGGWPWYWYMFRNPITFGLFFLFFTTALAEGNRSPFNLPEAESELVAGYSTEYSGMRYVFFFFAEWANVFVMSGIACALFLGGWQLPGVSPAMQEDKTWLMLLGVVWFLLKSWILIFVVIWVGWTLPRIRIDQLMNLCWKWFVPLSFLGFVLTGIWVIFINGAQGETQKIAEIVQLGFGIAMFAVWLLILAVFAWRVRYNLKNAKVPIHVNPFL